MKSAQFDALMRKLPCWVLTRICVVVHCIKIVLAVKNLTRLDWTENFSRLCPSCGYWSKERSQEKKGGGDVTVRWCKGLEINRLLISRPFCVRLCVRSHAIISRPFCHYAATISSSFRDDFACDSGLYFTSSDDNTSQLGSNEDLRCWALHENRARWALY